MPAAAAQELNEEFEDIEQYVGDQAYQMYQELLDIVRSSEQDGEDGGTSTDATS